MTRRRLFTGRAGSGKTRAVLSRIAERVRERREAECLLLLPTQGQVDHLSGLLLREGASGFRSDFAHTFFTFARFLARELPGQLLSEEARDYLIGDLLRLERFPAFDKVRTYPGFRRVLGRVIQELKENAIDPGDYSRRILDPLRERGRVAGRHRDLGKAFEAYERLLAEMGRIDAEDLALRAVARLEREPGLLGERTLLLVDGFHDFTPVQFRILSLLAERVPEAVFALSFDPALPEHPGFGASVATRRALLGMGFREETLTGNHRTRDATLLRLEEGLFAPPCERAKAGKSIRLTRSSRREEEVEEIARSIVRLVRQERVPYREMAVLYHDLSEVGELIEGTFRRFGIPVRLNRPRPLDRQPLVRFLLDLGRTLALGPDRETIIRLLRSGYVVGLDLSEVDRLDELLRRAGPPDSPSGWKPLCADRHLPGVLRVMDVFSEIGGRLRGKHTAPILQRGWMEAFQELGLPLGEEGPRGAEECAALEVFRRVLDEAGVRVSRGKGNPTLGVLLENVEEGVAEATFRVRDRRREVVNVISAAEARHWEIPHLFVAGVLERQFPPFPVEDLFFDDEERRLLSGAGLRFPGRDWIQSEERFLFYTALTRARDGLHLSHSVSDGQGNPTLPSFFLGEIGRIFTPESLRARTSGRPASAVLPAQDEVASLVDVDRMVFLGLEERFPRDGMPDNVATAAALYQRRIEDPAFRRRLAAAEEPRPAFEDRRIRDELLTADVVFSNSSLTSFLQCPYLHFAERWLRLDPLPGRRIIPPELGEVLHAALRDCFAPGERGDPLEILSRHFEELAARKCPAFRHRAEFWRLRRVLKSFLASEMKRLQETGLSPVHVEKWFGTGRNEDPPPVLLEVDGRAERFSGRIDRIDVLPGGKAGVVVDYKYSAPGAVREDLKSSLAEEIEDFQIVLYLLALREALGLEPAAAELVALKKGIERFGIGRREILNAAGGAAGAQEGWDLLEEEAYRAWMGRARERMGELVRGIRSGDIGTKPHDPRRCGPGSCDAADVCRFDRWIGGKPGGE